MSSKVLTFQPAPRTLTSGGEALREMRLLAGKTQEQAGELVTRRLDARQVRRFENGESPVVVLELYRALEDIARTITRRAA